MIFIIILKNQVSNQPEITFFYHEYAIGGWVSPFIFYCFLSLKNMIYFVTNGFKTRTYLFICKSKRTF